MNIRMRRFCIALATSAVLLLTACGEGNDTPDNTPSADSGSRPSVEEIKAALTSGEVPEYSSYQKLPDAVLECMAKVLHDPGFSDDALNALLEGDKSYPYTQEDLEALKSFKKAGRECPKKVASQD